MKTGGGGQVWWGSEESLYRLPARPCMGEEGGKEVGTDGGGGHSWDGDGGGQLEKEGACGGGEGEH